MMKFGICLPYMKDDYDRDAILSWCRAIDKGPFASLSCGERISGNSYEMRALLAAAAAVTERVRIVPSLYVLPMHNAVWAAKEIATLDVISGGRVTLTVGVGGREQDYQAVEADFSRRHQRMDEQVAVLRDTWAGKPPAPGLDPVGPAPVQAGGPPILAGAMGPKAIARAAAWADGLYGFALNGESHIIQYFFDTADQCWQDAGREEKPYRMGGFWFSLADNAKQQLQNYTYNYLRIAGEQIARDVAATMTRHNEDAVREAIDTIEETGCQELMLVPATADLRELDAISELLDKR